MAKKTNSQIIIQSGTEDEDVQDALTMMSKDSVIHNKHEGIWRAIQQLFEGTFVVNNPSGTKKISSKLLQQVLWKVVNNVYH